MGATILVGFLVLCIPVASSRKYPFIFVILRAYFVLTGVVFGVVLPKPLQL